MTPEVKRLLSAAAKVDWVKVAHVAGVIGRVLRGDKLEDVLRDHDRAAEASARLAEKLEEPTRAARRKGR